MPLLNRTVDTSPQALNQRVVAARQAYDAERSEIIDLATERQAAITAIVADLQAEDAALNDVVINAQK